MAFDEALAQRIRMVLADAPGIVEKQMFGGVGFLLDGNMACGVIGDGMIVRVGPQAYQDALDAPPYPCFRLYRTPDERLGGGDTSRLRR